MTAFEIALLLLLAAVAWTAKRYRRERDEYRDLTGQMTREVALWKDVARKANEAYQHATGFPWDWGPTIREHRERHGS